MSDAFHTCRLWYTVRISSKDSSAFPIRTTQVTSEMFDRMSRQLDIDNIPRGVEFVYWNLFNPWQLSNELQHVPSIVKHVLSQFALRAAQPVTLCAIKAHRHS